VRKSARSLGRAHRPRVHTERGRRRRLRAGVGVDRRWCAEEDEQSRIDGAGASSQVSLLQTMGFLEGTEAHLANQREAQLSGMLLVS